MKRIFLVVVFAFLGGIAAGGTAYAHPHGSAADALGATVVQALIAGVVIGLCAGAWIGSSFRGRACKAAER